MVEIKNFGIVKEVELDDLNYNIYISGVLEKKVRNGQTIFKRLGTVRWWEPKIKSYITETYYFKNGVKTITETKISKNPKN